MGLKYLWDTNTVVDYLQKNFTESVQKSMDNLINKFRPAISVITEIELLCWKASKQDDIALLHSFISDCLIFELDREIKLKTIEIRRIYNLKLPDAVIAATAFSNDLILISNDRRGFNRIPALKLFNPVLNR